jgi:signal transduction histidine kinase
MRIRLILLLLGVVALVLAVQDIPLAGHLEGVERDRLVTGLERDAFILAGRTEEMLEEGDPTQQPIIEALVAEYSAQEDVRVVVVDASAIGVVGSEVERTEAIDFSNRPEIATALDGLPSTGRRESVTLGEDLFFVAVPVLSGNDVVGAVRLSAPERVVEKRTNERVRGIFAVAGISLLIAAAMAWLFSLTVTRPLERLRAATHRLAAGDLATRADADEGPPEIRDLATSFNSMAARLEQLVERQRAFAGTASHQLRTPLTALRLRLERLANQDADAATTVAVEDALAETDRLGRMIEGLLALSRADDAATGPTAVDLARVVDERVRHWAPLADEHGVRLTADHENSASTVLAIDGAAEQIIDNLIDNALDASPSGSLITVRVLAADDETALHVIDEGPGLTADDRERAFDRFWRGDNAGAGGTGLGLAIVHQLAAAAGGRAELREAPGGGIDATVAFLTA